MSAAPAPPLRIVDLFDPLPPEPSRYSPEDKASILREARQTAAAARESITSPRPSPPRFDPVGKWRSEVDARENEMECARRELDRREQRQRERRQRQHQQHQQSWADFIAEQIRSAVQGERERSEAILIGLLADLLRSHDEMEKRIAALESKR